MRCAKVLGMASYGALLQLPREQLKEIVSRSDGKALKVGLREFVLKKVCVCLGLRLIGLS